MRSEADLFMLQLRVCRTLFFTVGCTGICIRTGECDEEFSADPPAALSFPPLRQIGSSEKHRPAGNATDPMPALSGHRKRGGDIYRINDAFKSKGMWILKVLGKCGEIGFSRKFGTVSRDYNKVAVEAAGKAAHVARSNRLVRDGANTSDYPLIRRRWHRRRLCAAANESRSEGCYEQ